MGRKGERPKTPRLRANLARKVNRVRSDVDSVAIVDVVPRTTDQGDPRGYGGRNACHRVAPVDYAPGLPRVVVERGLVKSCPVGVPDAAHAGTSEGIQVAQDKTAFLESREEVGKVGMRIVVQFRAGGIVVVEPHQLSIA